MLCFAKYYPLLQILRHRLSKKVLSYIKVSAESTTLIPWPWTKPCVKRLLLMLQNSQGWERWNPHQRSKLTGREITCQWAAASKLGRLWYRRLQTGMKSLKVKLSFFFKFRNMKESWGRGIHEVWTSPFLFLVLSVPAPSVSFPASECFSIAKCYLRTSLHANFIPGYLDLSPRPCDTNKLEQRNAWQRTQDGSINF